MTEVKRSILFKALLLHVTEERAKDIMKILEPLFRMCAHEQFFYGHNPNVPAEFHTAIEFLTERPCVGIECIAESIIPQRLLISLQNSNFITRTRLNLERRLELTLTETLRFNLTYDLRYSFGTRLLTVLPNNLWNQLWESVRYWLLCEVAGKKFEQEAAALEQIVQMCANGYIPFDFNPVRSNIAHIVNAKTSTTNAHYRTR